MQERKALAELDERIRAILPEEYQDTYEDVQPVSMGSAGLKYGNDGRVAWNAMWASFCDLAMAGGPPHKGMLLEPALRAEIDANPDRYADVVEEICRGIAMVTYLDAQPSPTAGWIRVDCLGDATASWLLRAIVMENVSARSEGPMLDLPAGPAYRLGKEIKNVITVMAKTCHYWMEHMSRTQQRLVATLFETMAEESPLVAPAHPSEVSGAETRSQLADRIADSVAAATGMSRSSHRYADWVGFESPNVRAAIWMMRVLVVSNVLARREGTVLFVPVNPTRDPAGAIVSGSVARLHGLARLKGVL